MSQSVQKRRTPENSPSDFVQGNTCVEHTQICDNGISCGFRSVGDLPIGAALPRWGGGSVEIMSVFGMSHAPHAAWGEAELPLVLTKQLPVSLKFVRNALPAASHDINLTSGPNHGKQRAASVRSAWHSVWCGIT